MGIPMKVVESGPAHAMCEYNGEMRQIDTMLIGEQPPGTWLLVFINAAREVISTEEAQKITDALSSLNSIMNGGDGDIDTLFADIIENSAANRKEIH